MSGKVNEWTVGPNPRPDFRGMSLTEYNRLRDRLDQQTWTKADVRRLQDRVRRVQKASL